MVELGRVLEPSGIAGFAEPGPEPSQTPQSQYEMKTHGVVENDIDVRSLWRVAHRVGFTDIKLAIFQVDPTLTDLDGFDDFLKGGETSKKYIDDARTFLTLVCHQRFRGCERRCSGSRVARQQGHRV